MEKIVYENGNVYEGKWKNGMKCGKGRLTYPNGDYFEGIWKDDKMKYGKLVYGLYTFVSSWKNDMPIGKGKYILEGKKYKSIQYVENDENGNRIIRKGKQEMLYEGEIKNGKRNGYGTLYFTNSEKEDGYWVDDKKMI